MLQRVPGIQFGQDVNGIVGIGFRGLWAHEGRVLLRLDGHELNELMYLTTQFGNDFPVTQIDRIEVIRGAGATLYGGMAELTVVNIVTVRGRDLDGAALAVDVGATANGLARTNVSFSLGGVVQPLGGLEVSVAGFFGHAVQSNKSYDDGAGTVFPLQDNSGIHPALLSAKLAWHDVHLSLLWRNYEVTDRTGFVLALARPGRATFSGLYLDASWDGKITDTVTLTPRLGFKQEQPFNSTSTDPDLSSMYYDRTAHSVHAGLSLTYRPLKMLLIEGGIEGAVDQAHTNSMSPSGDDVVGYGEPLPENGWRTWGRGAGWLGVRLTTFVADVDVSARIDYHGVFGASLSPRLSVGKVFGRFHYKLLAEQSTKNPGFENQALNPELGQETGRSYEVELGWLATDSLYLQLNVADTRIYDAIVYGVNESGNETYVNLSGVRLGTASVEAMVRWRSRFGFASLSYSFYSPRGLSDSQGVFNVPDHPNDGLAFAAHKVALSATFETSWGLRISPALLFYSTRWAAVTVDADGNVGAQRLPAAFLLDLWLDWKVPFAKGLSIGGGVHNLLDSDFPLAQPYAGGKAPLPTMGREFNVRLRWEGS